MNPKYTEFEERIKFLEQENEKLRRNCAMLAQIDEYSPDIIVLLDTEFCIKFVNRSVSKLSCLQYHNVIGKRLDEIVAPASTHALRSLMHDFAIYSNTDEWSKIPHRLELLFNCGSNKVSWGEIVLSLVYDINGICTGVLGIIRNINDRKVKDNETRYLAAIIDSTEDHATIKDLNLRVIAANKALIKAVGKTNLQEIIGKTDIEVFGDYPHVREYVRHELEAQLLNRGEEIVAEEKFITPTGEVHYTLVKKFPVFDETGQLIATANLSHDITARKEVEEKSLETALRMEAVIDAVSEGITLSDYNGYFEIYNKKMEEITGYTRDEANRIPNFIDCLYRNNSDREQVFVQLHKMIHYGGRNKSETRIVTKQGQEKYLSIYTTLLKYNRHEYFLSVYQDITDRKAAEQALAESENNLRAIVENAPCAIWTVDTDLRLIKFNQAFSAFCKSFLNLDVFAGLQFGNTSTIPSALDWTPNYRRVLAGEEFEIEFEIKLHDRPVYLFNQFTPIFDQSQHITGALILSNDITHRKYSEEALRKSEQKLRELNRTKDKFFNIIAHDLKTPFNTLLGFTEILISQSESLTNDETKEIHHLLFESSQQGFALLTNLLEWSRSQTGKIVFEPEVINVKAVVDDVVSLMQFTATKKEISIQTNLPSDLFVYADKNMIKTVLRNLISNAIKFTYRGRSVKLTAHREDGTIAIAVIDNGIGMTEEVKQKLFRLEEECTTAGTEQEKGTGLGLALCREFMERNNGKITVDSRSGVGSTFTVFFPAPQVI